MNTISIHKIDETQIAVSASDSGIYMELYEHFSFYADGYKFMPLYRNRMWDGKVRLFNMRNHGLPYGLLPQAISFLKNRGYSISLAADLCNRAVPSESEVAQYLDSLILSGNDGKHISFHDYQHAAVRHAIREGRALIVSPTGSGKSLIIYALIRWFLENSEESEKAIIIVPTTSLVQQLLSDFAAYSVNDPAFDAAAETHGIYSGKEKNNLSARVIITTWQSALTMPRAWFSVYGCVVGDEAHLFKAKSLNEIMNRCSRAALRIGTTGTLDGSVCNESVLIGNFGPVYKTVTTRALMESDTLSQLEIRCIVLQYEDEIRKVVSKLQYADEINFLVSHAARNIFIRDLALNCSGNTLVLFNLVEKHGKPLHALLTEAAAAGRRIFYVSGETHTLIREEVRALTEKENDCIIVASSATFSTGINIKNLHNIIFAAPTKSQIRVLQSIGRGLRKADNGMQTTVYDVSDDLSWKKNKNYTLRHAADRVKIYEREKFKYSVKSFTL